MARLGETASLIRAGPHNRFYDGYGRVEFSLLCTEMPPWSLRKTSLATLLCFLESAKYFSCGVGGNFPWHQRCWEIKDSSVYTLC
jgi:hypothetical protein